MKNNNGKGKRVLAVLLILAALALLLLIFGGNIMNEIKKLTHEGNLPKYSPERVEPLSESPLRGYNVLYLGSSVTNGSASLGDSFAEYIAKRHGTEYLKEAVNGTTLVAGKSSYIERLEKIDKASEFDLVICQLSTNDATRGEPLGAPSLTETPDVSTVCGAIEHIINYVRDTFDCPVIFYTNSYYESENYAAMVAALHEIAELYGVGVIDLYTDTDFNEISDAKRALYMADSIHPTRAGYLEWWTPEIEKGVIEYLENGGFID